jgi:hypothetical protein
MTQIENEGTGDKDDLTVEVNRCEPTKYLSFSLSPSSLQQHAMDMPNKERKNQHRYSNVKTKIR